MKAKNVISNNEKIIFKQRMKIKEKVKSQLMDSFKESLISVLPITAIVMILSFTITPIPTAGLLSFLVGSTLLIVGMSFFTIGADMAMTSLGERVGVHITKSRKIWIVVVVSFLIGTIVTISEPDLQVLATQIWGIPNSILIGAVSVGAGAFLVIALLRIIFAINLSHILIVSYTLIFILAFFVSPDFLAIAFDSGGVTTGPITVPFIMALGIGVSSMRSDKNANRDSFGLVALSSIGPILAVFFLAFVYKPDGSIYTPVVIPEINDSVELWDMFLKAFPTYMKEIAISLAPIIGFFIIFQLVAMRLSKQKMLKIIFGFIYTYVGLILFLTGVNVGFMPVGSYIGQSLASLDYNWIIIPIAIIIGYFIVAAEPAVHVLNAQVENITAGAIPAKAMNIAISIGVAVSLALSMLRVLYGIPILWFLLPGYAIAILLTFVVPKIFTSIAFDSGGVASGTMTATFLLAFSMGACEAVGGNVVSDAFGIVAMVAMTPLITIQLLGVYYKIKMARNPQMDEHNILENSEIDEDNDEIIEM